MSQSSEGEAHPSSLERMPSQSLALLQLDLAQHGNQLPDPLLQMQREQMSQKQSWHVSLIEWA